MCVEVNGFGVCLYVSSYTVMALFLSLITSNTKCQSYFLFFFSGENIRSLNRRAGIRQLKVGWTVYLKFKSIQILSSSLQQSNQML